MSARDVRLAALSHLNHARAGLDEAVRELGEVKQGLGLLGLSVGGIDRVRDGILQGLERLHTARCALWSAASDDMRSDRCA